MYSKKIVMVSSITFLLIFISLILIVFSLRQIEIKQNTPDWLKVQVFEYEKKLKSKVQDVRRCSIDKGETSENIYILSFNQSNLEVVLSDDSSYYCDSGEKKCSNQIKSASRCVYLFNK